MEKNLKPKQYYIDLYDRHTVERYRDLIRIHSEPMKNPPLIYGQKPTKKLVDVMSKWTIDFALMFEKSDRYIRKEETIERWMAADQEKDELYESAKAPENIRCLTCRSVMSVTRKDLWDRYQEPSRVLFMYECPNKCLPHRAFYHDGEEWEYRPDPCPKCGSRLNSEDETTKEKFITRYKCSSCDFTKIDKMERTTNKEEEPDLNFAADKAKYCLSKEEGEKWRESMAKWEEMGKLVDKLKEEDKNKELYDKMAKIKKLTIIDLEKLLNPILEKTGYIKFQLSTPEIGKDVIVPFGVHDSKNDRAELASQYDLKIIINKTLENTNWRLMSDGVSYRLGFLSGRLRGLEKEEDLLKSVLSKQSLSWR